MKNIIVTLKMGDYCEDYELPGGDALGKLYPRMTQILKEAGAPIHFSCQSIVFEQEGKGLLDMHACLLDYGICTGALLEVADRRKYNGL